MKGSIKYLFVLFLACSIASITAQEKLIKKAHSLFNTFAYAEAIESYKKIIKKGNGTLEVYKKLGDCYYYNSNLKDGARWYQKMWDRQKEIVEETEDTVQLLEYQLQESLDIPVEYYFKTAHSYKFLKKYNKADSIIKQLKEKNIEDSRVKRFLEQPDYLDKIDSKSGRYIIENIPQNSLGVDFAPSFYKDQIVFSSSRADNKRRKKSQWTQQPYLDLYKFKNQNSLETTYSQVFSEAINSRLHESTSAFSKEGDIVYFTRNNLLDSKSVKDSTGIIRLKIYQASLDKNLKWSEIKELPFNNDEYSVAHPALNIDGTKVYFASDMPGGYGMSDLYEVEIKSDGTFGAPKNLGADINTEGRDTFPFMSHSGTLYFASDGHLGLGGLDIFAVKLEGDDKTVYNVGKPINSSADDMTFIFDEDSRKGYFASNRSGGRGNDDIYSFIETTPLITKCECSFNGIVADGKSGNILNNANIEVRDSNNIIVFAGKTNEKGETFINLDCGDKTYEITVQKEDYDPVVENIKTSRDDLFLYRTIKLKSNVPEKGIDLAKLLNLKPIYFDSNKALILNDSAKELDKVIDYMKEYLSIKIEIGSHTDSKGSDRYNMNLSERRATSTANYVISKGVDPLRVKSRGYGETVLINRCENGVRCSKDEHAQNRRSEFIVIEN